MLDTPTISLSIAYVDPITYFALSRAEHRQIERSLVGQVQRDFPRSLLDAWAVLDPAQVGVGGQPFEVADESMSIGNVRSYVDDQLARAGSVGNSFRTLNAAGFAAGRECVWIDNLHIDKWGFFLERNQSGQPYRLTGTASSGRTAEAYIRVLFGFEEPSKASVS